MTVMDRYILRHFAGVFFICFCSLIGLWVVIDVFSNLDDFLNYAEGRGNVLGIMGQYYACRVLGYFNLIGPILTLISAMFTVAWLRRYNELTSLSAAGIRNARVVAPIVVAAIVISLVSAVSRELVIPNFRYQLSHKVQDLSGAAKRELRPRYDHETDVRIGGAGTFADAQRIHEPRFILPESLDNYGRRLLAAEAYYKPPEKGRPGGYLLEGVREPKLLSEKPSLPIVRTAAGSTDEGPPPIIITPRDALWLDDDQVFVVSNVKFDQLEDSAVWRQYASIDELIEGLHNPSLDYGADVRVEIHARFVRPLLDVALLFLGLPLILARGNPNMYLAAGFALAIVAGFFLLVIACHWMGRGNLVSPALAAWLPALIVVPMAVLFSEPLRQ